LCVAQICNDVFQEFNSMRFEVEPKSPVGGHLN
jgi:hypothetical protein